jgi:hypothetical protein
MDAFSSKTLWDRPGKFYFEYFNDATLYLLIQCLKFSNGRLKEQIGPGFCIILFFRGYVKKTITIPVSEELNYQTPSSTVGHSLWSTPTDGRTQADGLRFIFS